MGLHQRRRADTGAKHALGLQCRVDCARLLITSKAAQVYGREYDARAASIDEHSVLPVQTWLAAWRVVGIFADSTKICVLNLVSLYDEPPRSLPRDSGANVSRCVGDGSVPQIRFQSIDQHNASNVLTDHKADHHGCGHAQSLRR